MSAQGGLPQDFGPDWLIAEMPPGDGTRLAEIRRLTADLQAMIELGRLLYDIGPGLASAVAEMCSGLGFDTVVLPETDGTGVAVQVDTWNRLLLQVATDDHAVERKSPEIARVFQLLHQVANEHDRVVFVTNTDRLIAPGSRRDALTPDAHEFLKRMGASHVTAATLFSIWKLSLESTDRARDQFQRLHKHPGGTFDLSLAARV
jgi:hypothetical protein